MAPRSKAFNRGASVNIHSTGISCSSRLITRSTAQQQQPPTQLKAQTQQQLQEQQQQEQEEQDPDPDPESESGLGTESLLSTSSLPSQQQQFSYPKRSHTPSNSPHHRWSTSSLSSDIGRKSLHPTFTLNANLIPQLLEVISVIDIGVLPTDSLSETQNRVGLVHSAVKTLVFALLTCKSPSRHCQTFMAVISLLSRAREVTGIRAALFEDLHNAKTLLELIIAKTAFGIDDFMMEEIGAWELFHNASTFAENLHEESEEAKMMLQPIVYQYSTHRTVLLGSVEEEGFPRATRIFTSTTTSNPSVYSERKAEDGSFLSSEVSDVSVLEELEVRPYSRCTLETPATSHLGMQPSFSNACNMIQRLPLAAARLKPPNTATRKQISWRTGSEQSMAPTLDSTTQTFLHSHDLVRRFIFHIEYGGKDLEDRVARLDEVMRRHSLWEGVMLKKVISFRKDLKGEQDRAMFEEFREEGERNGREELGHLSQRFPEFQEYFEKYKSSGHIPVIGTMNYFSPLPLPEEKNKLVDKLLRSIKTTFQVSVGEGKNKDKGGKFGIVGERPKAADEAVLKKWFRKTGKKGEGSGAKTRG